MSAETYRKSRDLWCTIRRSNTNGADFQKEETIEVASETQDFLTNVERLAIFWKEKSPQLEKLLGTVVDALRCIHGPYSCIETDLEGGKALFRIPAIRGQYEEAVLRVGDPSWLIVRRRSVREPDQGVPLSLHKDSLLNALAILAADRGSLL